MPRPKTRLCGLVLGLCATLSACTDPGFYTDHREGITFYGGNAVASNIAVQTIDPWPPHASDRAWSLIRSLGRQRSILACLFKPSTWAAARTT